jgi:hypothetical protein
MQTAKLLFAALLTALPFCLGPRPLNTLLFIAAEHALTLPSAKSAGVRELLNFV